jgi:hypothetical protein
MKSWDTIQSLIQEKYPPSVLLIRDKMKRVLGFTTRQHEEWFHRNAESKNLGYGTMYCETYMHLDFYDEPKRTMFLLKYGDHIEIGKTALDKESEKLYN